MTSLSCKWYQPANHNNNGCNRIQRALTFSNVAGSTSWARFIYLGRSKLRLCLANHREGYLSNLACDWLSIVWAYSEQDTGNGPRSSHPFGAMEIKATWNYPDETYKYIRCTMQGFILLAHVQLIYLWKYSYAVQTFTGIITPGHVYRDACDINELL